jgi:uncharacterized iron-regulated membrane protein
VAESSPSWPIQRNKVAIHPPLAKLTTIGIPAHTGTLFGLVNQLTLAAMALGLLAVLFCGYRMWWLRRPTRATTTTGAPAPRGGLTKWSAPEVRRGS